MITIPMGKYRALQQCSTPRGAISILALDHRNNLRAALNPQSPEQVSAEQISAFKVQVVAALAPAATAVLLDPPFGVAQCLSSGALPGQVGLLSALEETGYTGDPNARLTALLPGWSVEKIKRIGASAVKLLVYYHPRSEMAVDIEELVAQVAKECTRHELPLFVEPLSYSLDPAVKKLSPAERRSVVIETAQRLTPLGVDVLKAEFPVDARAETSEQVWAEACAELTRASRCPWVLLSASVAYDTFLRQVAVACQQGASGVAVGRAVWQEGPALHGLDLQDYLRQVAGPRMQRLTALCEALARPWQEYYQPPRIDENWYTTY